MLLIFIAPIVPFIILLILPIVAFSEDFIGERLNIHDRKLRLPVVAGDRHCRHCESEE